MAMVGKNDERTVIYLGPAGTYTHLACFEHFRDSIRAIPEESIQEIFEAVERKTASYGVVPIENSTEGSVNRTLDMFIDSGVKICGEVLIRISHALLSQSGKLEDVEKIYSHPQAFGQCQQWLKSNFSHVPLTETISTAKAAKMATDDRKSAAIASSFAGRLYGLEVITSRIEDYPHNYTRFLVLSQEIADRTERDKTSILFTTPHVPGSLYRVLKVFAEKEINLTKIESRPMKGTPWEYVFFVDFEGHAMDSHIGEVLGELKENVLSLKLLGSYPRRSWERS